MITECEGCGSILDCGCKTKDEIDFDSARDTYSVLFDLICTTVGHAESRHHTYKLKHSQKPEFQWDDCSSCGQILSGESPNPSDIVNDEIIDRMPNLNKIFEQTSPFFDYISKNH